MRRVMKLLSLMLLGLMALWALSIAPAPAFGQSAYTKGVDSVKFSAQGQSYTIQNMIGALNLTFEYLVSGSPASLTMTIQGCMRGGTCATLDTYSSTSSAIRTVNGLYDNYVIAVTTLSGGSSPTVQMNTIFSSLSTPSPTTGTGSAQGDTLIAFLNTFAAADAIANSNIGFVPSSTGSSFAPVVVPYVFNGSTWDRPFYCNKTTAITALGAATTQMVAASGSTKIRVCSAVLSQTGTTATNVKFVEGTGSNCGTGQTNVTGTVAAFGTSVGTIALGLSPTGAITTNTGGDALCATGSAAGAVDITISYAQY